MNFILEHVVVVLIAGPIRCYTDPFIWSTICVIAKITTPAYMMSTITGTCARRLHDTAIFIKTIIILSINIIDPTMNS